MRVSSRSLAIGFVALFLMLVCCPSALAIPAFARKYGLPCSACHEAWPKLNSFGQTFRDSGYQLNNERDAPIYQHPSYWPIAMRISLKWHYEISLLVDVATASGTEHMNLSMH